MGVYPLSRRLASFAPGRLFPQRGTNRLYAMASTRLADEVLRHLGVFLDDPTLCAVACSERLSWDWSGSQRQERKDEQVQFLQLVGRAEDGSDCERAAELLDHPRIVPFVHGCFWIFDPDGIAGAWFHLNFRSSRRNLPLLRRAVKTFLRRLRTLSDLHVLRESLTFRDECVGDRAYDDGDHHQADILRRVFVKVNLHCRGVIPCGGSFGVWFPPELRQGMDALRLSTVS